MGKHVITLYISIKLLLFVTWKSRLGMPQKTQEQSDWDSRLWVGPNRAA